jgi:hypothetical protein
VGRELFTSEKSPHQKPPLLDLDIGLVTLRTGKRQMFGFSLQVCGLFLQQPNGNCLSTVSQLLGFAHNARELSHLIWNERHCAVLIVVRSTLAGGRFIPHSVDQIF